jgi:hypothetical protein
MLGRHGRAKALWSLENPLQLPFHFPYVLILPFFLWPAFLGHIVLARKLLSEE